MRAASRTSSGLRHWRSAAAACVMAMCLAGCDATMSDGGVANSARGRQGGEPIRVLATTAMIADIVRQVAGERASIEALMGPGVDPHLYRPTRDDVSRMLDADIVFYNGLNLEGKMTDTFVTVARSGKPVYAVTERIEESYLIEPPGAEGHHDPHVWMDPRGWIKATEVVADALAEFDPEGASLYRGSAGTYASELERLDEYARSAIATIPEQARVLITAHDAFNYFARAYGIEVRGIQGISTESEAGLRQIEELVDLLVKRRIPSVFTETSVSDRNVRALVEGARARGHEVAIGGSLFSDAMGAAGTYEGTYIGMIDHNVTVIVRALGGEAPAGGMNGKLAGDA